MHENTQVFNYPEVPDIYDINLEDWKLLNSGIVGGAPNTPYYHNFQLKKIYCSTTESKCKL